MKELMLALHDFRLINFLEIFVQSTFSQKTDLMSNFCLQFSFENIDNSQSKRDPSVQFIVSPYPFHLLTNIEIIANVTSRAHPQRCQRWD